MLCRGVNCSRAFKFSEHGASACIVSHPYTAGPVRIAASRRCGSFSRDPAAGTSHETSPADLQRRQPIHWLPLSRQLAGGNALSKLTRVCCFVCLLAE